MQSHEIQRLADTLLRHKHRLGSWHALAEAVSAANENDPERRIDRRTLERICGENGLRVQLKMSQLVALDHFFGVSNDGPILVKQRSLLDSVCESHTANLLLAVKYIEVMRSEVVSQWDFRATTTLLRSSLGRLQINLFDIAKPNQWSEQDPRMANASHIAIGSPAANPASDELMSSMLGVAPGGPPDLEKLPFFIVGAKRDRNIVSSFIATWEDAARARRGKPEPVDDDKRALVFNDRWYVSNGHEDYALLLAQRNPDNAQVRMVLCGLTGPGTTQLGQILRAGEPAETLPALRKGERHPPILAACYRLTLAPEHHDRVHNEDRVISYTRIENHMFIQLVDGLWQFPP